MYNPVTGSDRALCDPVGRATAGSRWPAAWPTRNEVSGSSVAPRSAAFRFKESVREGSHGDPRPVARDRDELMVGLAACLGATRFSGCRSGLTEGLVADGGRFQATRSLDTIQPTEAAVVRHLSRFEAGFFPPPGWFILKKLHKHQCEWLQIEDDCVTLNVERLLRRGVHTNLSGGSGRTSDAQRRAMQPPMYTYRRLAPGRSSAGGRAEPSADASRTPVALPGRARLPSPRGWVEGWYRLCIAVIGASGRLAMARLFERWAIAALSPSLIPPLPVRWLPSVFPGLRSSRAARIAGQVGRGCRSRGLRRPRS